MRNATITSVGDTASRWFAPRGWLDDPTVRLERVIAGGRAFLTGAALLAIYLDPTEPARFASLTYTVLGLYAAYALAVLALVRRSARLSARQGLALHGADILWTSLLTFLSSGPVSPFFLFFLFVVLASAYRWGFRETLATSVVTVAIALLETVVAFAGPWSRAWFGSVAVEPNRLLLQVAYLLLTGALLGYLAEEQQRSRTELAASALAAKQARVELGTSGSLAAIAGLMMKTFHARAVVVVLRRPGREARLWRFEPQASGAPRVVDRGRRPVPPPWMHARPAGTWYAEATADGSTTLWTVVPGEWPLRTSVAMPPPVEIDTEDRWRTMASACLDLSDAGTGRLYLFDPSFGAFREQPLHFLDVMVDHVSPGLSNVMLTARLRSQAGAAERARVARELHDGAIQSLFAIEIKLEAIRRASAQAPAIVADLSDVQGLVRQEVLALRDLMQAVRPVELDSSDQLADVLAGIVDRFRRDTSIGARLIAPSVTPPINPERALEVVRIVQEALVNVRRHSRARNVLVRLSHRGGECELVIEDDGVGFGFPGRMTSAEMDRARVGPAIIRERARVLRADFALESTPTIGARLELTFHGDVHE